MSKGDIEEFPEREHQVEGETELRQSVKLLVPSQEGGVVSEAEVASAAAAAALLAVKDGAEQRDELSDLDEDSFAQDNEHQGPQHDEEIRFEENPVFEVEQDKASEASRPETEEAERETRQVSGTDTADRDRHIKCQRRRLI
jgi:hypothetical protein